MRSINFVIRIIVVARIFAVGRGVIYRRAIILPVGVLKGIESGNGVKPLTRKLAYSSALIDAFCM